MHLFSARSLSTLLFIALAAFAIALSACTPTSSPGVAEPTQTTGPDFDGIALATYAAGTATAVSDSGVEPTAISTGGPVPPEIVSPIQATFFPEQQATVYRVITSSTDQGEWFEPSCGDFQPDPDGLSMTWVHAHPPCDETTSHDDETIRYFIRVPTHDGVRLVECAYEGASTGFGEPCTWL